MNLVEANNHQLLLKNTEKYPEVVMKFLHLSDLHIGKRVNEVSMLDDQAYILDQILCIADVERPDAVLIAGDIYDRSIQVQ